ncbi:MAG: ribulose-phosphate 3-epimerase [Clostridia bacterium]|nr:ribulose-phosphate 3-epimerase [Clostridia bacterium]
MKLSASILTCDFSRLDRAVASAVEWGADWLHLDVMDGTFVPNLTFGAPVIRSLRPLCDLPFDVHLMMQHPEALLDDFVAAGAARITVHAECSAPLRETLCRIRESGCRAGLSLNPGTPIETVFPYLPLLDQVLVMTVQPGFGGQVFHPECLPKIESLKAEIRRRGLETLIEVDGGVKSANIRELAAAGVDVAVVGSALYDAADPESFVSLIHSL